VCSRTHTRTSGQSYKSANPEKSDWDIKGIIKNHRDKSNTSKYVANPEQSLATISKITNIPNRPSRKSWKFRKSRNVRRGNQDNLEKPENVHRGNRGNLEHPETSVAKQIFTILKRPSQLS
jgi:hypothetical protein